LPVADGWSGGAGQSPGDAEGEPANAAGKRATPANSVATAQQGQISRRQLLTSGLGSGAIQYRAQMGQLHRSHRGVYLVGHEALAPLAREWAAVLACGTGAVISHVSAARAWRVIDQPPAGSIDVTVIGRKLRSRAGIDVHRTERLARSDLAELDGLPITAPARTLMDLAAIDFADLERAFSEAHVLRLVSTRSLEAAIRRGGRRAGVGMLRALIAGHEHGFTRSKGEQQMHELLRRSQLPPPSVNLRLAGFLVDFGWPPQRLVVEVDGYRFHGHRAAFERDRRKDIALTAAGYQVIRVTWRQLTEEPLAVVATIARALASKDVHGREPG
jgi:very-short-patch-repair endonuclease